jgi:hypothetical protein
VEHNEVITPDSNQPLIKRMSLLRRRPDVTPETFLREWRAVHAPLVRSIAGVRGYRQNLIAELWLDSTEAIDAGFGPAQRCETMTYAHSFIAEITTFVVKPYVIV